MGKTSSMIAISLVLAMLLMGCAPRTTAVVNTKATDGIEGYQIVASVLTSKDNASARSGYLPTAAASESYLSSYIPVVEAAIAASAYSCEGSAFLYDLDADGIDELVISDHYAEVQGEEWDYQNSFINDLEIDWGYGLDSGFVFSVYDIENSEVITKCDKKVFPFSGGLGMEISVVNYSGITALCLFVDAGWPGFGEPLEKQYKIYDPNGFQIIATASCDNLTEYRSQVLDYLESGKEISYDDALNCYIDGQACSYAEYMGFIDAIETIVSAEFTFNDDADGSMTLEELLRYLRTASGTTPPTSSSSLAIGAYDDLVSKVVSYDQSVEIPEEYEVLEQPVSFVIRGAHPNSISGGTYLRRAPSGSPAIRIIQPNTEVIVLAVRGSLENKTGHIFVETPDGEYGWIRLDVGYMPSPDDF